LIAFVKELGVSKIRGSGFTMVVIVFNKGRSYAQAAIAVMFKGWKVEKLYRFKSNFPTLQPSNFSTLQRHKLQRYRIHTMPGVLGRQIFSFKYVTEVCPAISAHDLYAPSIRVRYAFYCAGYLVVKAGPAAMRFKLGFRSV